MGKYSSLHSLRAAAQQIWKQNEIEAMEKRLEQCHSQLAFRVVAAINEKVDGQNEKITEILSLNRSVASWIQPHAAIVTRRSGTTETLLRPRSWRDVTGQEAVDSEKAISFKPLSISHSHVSSQSEDDVFNATFDFAFSSVEARVVHALGFRNIDARRQGVVDTHGSTFQWLFDETSTCPATKGLLDWLGQGQGCFWISGKAGAGKSSLMKLIATHPRLPESLSPWVTHPDGRNQLVVASFFIYRYGERLQNSQEGLLRALLYQILDQRTDLIPIVFPSLCRTLAASYSTPTSLTLTLDELRTGFRLLVQSLSDSVQLFLIVDGIDEYSGDYQDLIQLLKMASASKSIKVLVSSRPIPSCESAFSTGPHLRLQDLTKPDILEYVRDKLEANNLMVEKEESEPGITREIADNVCDKASGVFLWVSLVVRSLLVGLENYDRKKDLLARIDELPADLEKLYSFMMSSVSVQYQQEASLILQLVCRSRQIQVKYPLTVLQLSFAEEAELDGNTDNNTGVTEYTEISRRCKAMEGRMRSRCCGLIEAQTIQFSNTCCHAITEEKRVDFLHRSVVEFLELSEVWEVVKSTNPLSEHRLDELLLSSTVKEAKSSGNNPQTQCKSQEGRYRGYNQHQATNARMVYNVIYCVRYSRSQGDIDSKNYVKQLMEIRDILRKQPSRLNLALTSLVNRVLPEEGVYLQGASDCKDGFLLYAAANGLVDFVSWMIKHCHPDEADLRILLLYLLTNINKPSTKGISVEERRTQVKRLTRSALSVLQQGLNPNTAGLYWPDIRTAAVTEDIELAVLRSPEQDNGLVPWIYWLTCYDPHSELLMDEKMCYYEILQAMINAGADLKGRLGGEGKEKVPILTLAQNTLESLSQQEPAEHEILCTIRRHLAEHSIAANKVIVQRPTRRHSRLWLITKGLSRIRVKEEGVSQGSSRS